MALFPHPVSVHGILLYYSQTKIYPYVYAETGFFTKNSFTCARQTLFLNWLVWNRKSTLLSHWTRSLFQTTNSFSFQTTQVINSWKALWTFNQIQNVSYSIILIFIIKNCLGGFSNKLTCRLTCVYAGNWSIYSPLSQPVSWQRISVQMILLHFIFKLISPRLWYEIRTNYITTLQKYSEICARGTK